MSVCDRWSEASGWLLQIVVGSASWGATYLPIGTSLDLAHCPEASLPYDLNHLIVLLRIDCRRRGSSRAVRIHFRMSFQIYSVARKETEEIVLQYFHLKTTEVLTVTSAINRNL